MKLFYKWCSDSKDLFHLKLRGCDVIFGKLFFCFMSFTHAESTSKSRSTYFYLSRMRNVSKCGFSKFQHKHFSYSLGKSERQCLFIVVVSWMIESGTFERLSVFPERPIDFDDFPEYGRTVTEGMYVCTCSQSILKSFQDVCLKLKHLMSNLNLSQALWTAKGRNYPLIRSCSSKSLLNFPWRVNREL